MKKGLIWKLILGMVVITLLIVGIMAGSILLPSIPTYTGPDVDVPGVRKRMLRVNGVKLHVAEAGKASDPLVLFLHGFPEFWYEWHKYLPHFAKLGYHAVAPDQRGYNLSDKPKDKSAYHTKHLAKDMAELIQKLGHKRAFVVGHDWGAMVTWNLAHKYPTLVRKAVIMNVPHPLVFAAAMKHNEEQKKKSRYIGFFQLPLIPEKILARNNWQGASQALTKSSNPGTYTKKMLAHYRHAWSRPGAITAMLNWYRAIDKTPDPKETQAWKRKIIPPVLVLWGAKDHALGKELAKPSAERCKSGKLVMLPKATHWLVHEKVKRIQTLIANFIKPTK